ncbi:unnamed protein product [Lepeophtheirus salmonis]|uniref:(salmon louse) hypothetical protein n=1 Tax=Lepeophtheirus salmonis TaxID=72036 RepID=A0A7R8CQS8_LEPSM|nr:unnamed protein product [Lepeophtheirus salmonis]CAF2898346.1 unnamed protein product [Lepeophtheirus salmonis]
MFLCVKDRYGIKFIMTSRGNQESYENLFSQLCQPGGPYDHPIPVDALNRILLLMLGRQAEFAVPSGPIQCSSKQGAGTTLDKSNRFYHIEDGQFSPASMAHTFNQKI